MPRGGGPELNDYAQEVKLILETAFSELGGAATALTAANIGTNVEAWSANLDALSALSSLLANAGQVPMIGNAGGWSLGAPLMDDRIINGAMRIDQRNVGGAVTPTTGVYLVDRWLLGISQPSKLTLQQLAPSPALARFTSALKLTVASAYSAGAGEAFFLTHKIEGNNIADLDYGLAGARTCVLSFWVQASVTGTYGLCLRNSASARSYLATYSVPVANTWTYITLTIPGDTTGTWLTTAGIGIELDFDLGSGSTFQSVLTGWQAGSALMRTAACVSFVANAAATFWITGVRLQPGSIATPYVLRPFGLELLLCQRYYQKSYDLAVAPGSVTGSTIGTLLGESGTGSVLRLFSTMPVRMRAQATPGSYSYATGTANAVRNDTTTADVATAGIFASQMSIGVIANFAGTGQQGQFHWTADAEL